MHFFFGFFHILKYYFLTPRGKKLNESDQLRILRIFFFASINSFDCSGLFGSNMMISFGSGCCCCWILFDERFFGIISLVLIIAGGVEISIFCYSFIYFLFRFKLPISILERSPKLLCGYFLNKTKKTGTYQLE